MCEESKKNIFFKDDDGMIEYITPSSPAQSADNQGVEVQSNCDVTPGEDEVPVVIHESLDPFCEEIVTGMTHQDKSTQADFVPESEVSEEQTLQPEAPLSINRIKSDAEKIHYYTGFDDYEHFLYVYRSLGPAAEELLYKSDSLSPQNEFLLCLVKLRQNKEDIELGTFLLKSYNFVLLL